MLGRHDRDLHVVVAHLARFARGHERELVRGQRPHGSQRHDDGQPLRVALVDVAQEPAVGVGVAFGPPCRRIVHAGDRSAAGRKEQRVEALRAAVAQAHLPVRVVDADGRIDDELSTGLFREALERHVVGMAHAERLRHRERAVGEVGVRGDQAQRDALARHGVQRKQGLQAGNTAAGDDDVHDRDHRAPPSHGARWAAQVAQASRGCTLRLPICGLRARRLPTTFAS